MCVFTYIYIWTSRWSDSLACLDRPVRCVDKVRPRVVARDLVRVQGSGCRVQGAGFMVQGSGCRVQGARFRVQGSGFRVQGAGTQRRKAR